MGCCDDQLKERPDLSENQKKKTKFQILQSHIKVIGLLQNWFSIIWKGKNNLMKILYYIQIFIKIIILIWIIELSILNDAMNMLFNLWLKFV